MEFVDWNVLSTMAGATFAVAILTEVTKGIPGIGRIPTQVWSLILAFVVLIGAQAAMGTLTIASGGLAVLNAALVSLAANGGYDLLERLKNGQKTGFFLDQKENRAAIAPFVKGKTEKEKTTCSV